MESTTFGHEPTIHWLPTNLLNKTYYFDGDDTAYETEGAAFRACARVVNELLRKKHCNYQFQPQELMKQFRGTNAREVMLKTAERFGFSLDENELQELIEAELEAAIEQLAREAETAPELVPVLEILQAATCPFALVSSSAKRRIDACLAKTGLGRFFPDSIVFSAVDSLSTPASKPSPAIYKFACEALGVSPEDCIAVEDSPNGVKSAVAAGIRTVGYVGLALPEEKAERRLALIEAGACLVIDSWDQFLPQLARVIDN
jgi:HAD superfamily hydrolase (TIGR01509 family)